MALLFDTCAMIWIATDAPIAPAAHEAIARDVGAARPTHVSPFSAWELGLLVARNRLSLTMTPARWFQQFLDSYGVALAPLTPELLVASSFLPGALHRDPADRILCATAREHGFTIVTRDRKILDYAAAGHCRALAC